jgi:ferredoxin
MEVKIVPTCVFLIHIAGDYDQARQVCREYCLSVGLCVTVTPTTFIYTGGEEAGVTVGVRHYPRFPSEPSELRRKAMELAELLRARLCQFSFMIEGPGSTEWASHRVETPAAK